VSELKSRWANGKLEDFYALADATEHSCCELSNGTIRAMAKLRASCPPLRTRAEVAEEALKTIQDTEAWFADSRVGRKLSALAEEPTR